MNKITKHLNSCVVTLYETQTKVILGKSEHIRLYVSAYDVDHYSDDIEGNEEPKRYFYDEFCGSFDVLELGEFKNIKEAEKSFFEAMTYMADEYFDGEIKTI